MALEAGRELVGVAPRRPEDGYVGRGVGLDVALLGTGALLAAGLAWLLLIYGEADGNLFAPVLALGLVLVVPFILRKPIVGLYILMGAAVAIEENPLGFGAEILEVLFIGCILITKNVLGLNGVVPVAPAGFLLKPRLIRFIRINT